MRFWDPGYYRTYPDPADQPAGYMSVQSEVERHRKPTQRQDVPRDERPHQAIAREALPGSVR
jgi:hypothetical protein